MSHERAKEQVRECFEVERSEAKQVRKCEREKKAAEEKEASRKWMEGVAKKKKRIEQEVRSHYEATRGRPQLLGQVKREQMEDDFEFDTEGIFETAGGGSMQSGSQASGHQNEPASLPLPPPSAAKPHIRPQPQVAPHIRPVVPGGPPHPSTPAPPRPSSAAAPARVSRPLPSAAPPQSLVYIFFGSTCVESRTLPRSIRWRPSLVFFTTVDGSEIRGSPVEVGSLSHYLQGFSWCRISSINGRT